MMPVPMPEIDMSSMQDAVFGPRRPVTPPTGTRQS
jgi:hypothetical protein